MLAHFTSAELPGTLGLVLAAFALGLIAARRDLGPRGLTIPLLGLLAATLAIAVVSDLPSVHLADGVTLSADIAMVACAALLSYTARTRAG